MDGTAADSSQTAPVDRTLGMDIVRRYSAALVALTVASVAGCTTTSFTGPDDPTTVTLDLHVTGGVAGIDERLHIDGRNRLVQWHCSSTVCGDAPSVPFLLSEIQWHDLVAQTVASGLPTAGKQDYGYTCCDFFGTHLAYSDGEREARVSGDSGTLPPALVKLVSRLVALRQGQVPILLRPGAQPGGGYGRTDPLAIDSVRLDGQVLLVGVTYSGGCRPHTIDLVSGVEWMESFPVQTRAWLTHDGANDPCDALPSEVRRIDLAPLVAAYRAGYPGAPSGEHFVLRISGPGDATPHSVDVVLP